MGRVRARCEAAESEAASLAERLATKENPTPRQRYSKTRRGEVLPNLRRAATSRQQRASPTRPLPTISTIWATRWRCRAIFGVLSALMRRALASRPMPRMRSPIVISFSHCWIKKNNSNKINKVTSRVRRTTTRRTVMRASPRATTHQSHLTRGIHSKIQAIATKTVVVAIAKTATRKSSRVSRIQPWPMRRT